jgi:hypothetical protein
MKGRKHFVLHAGPLTGWAPAGAHQPDAHGRIEIPEDRPLEPHAQLAESDEMQRRLDETYRYVSGHMNPGQRSETAPREKGAVAGQPVLAVVR